MKKTLVFSVLAVVLVFTSATSAQDKGIYIGIGGAYNWENFDIEDVDLYGLDMDFDGALGLNLRAGYQFSDVFSAGLDLDFAQGFELEDSVLVAGVPVTMNAEVDIITYTLAAKVSVGGTEVVKPYFLAGVGAMSGDVKATGSAMGISITESESETDLCTKLAGGIDFYTSQNVSIGAEGSYMMGFGDMEEIRYFTLAIGVAYHFR